MCGICGVAWKDGPVPTTLEQFTQAVATLRHRGPDENGLYQGEQILLGFRRLAIIDLNRGSQPMSNEDGSIWLVFNGEIYNYQALRRRLEAAGHQFRSHADTEVLVHLYEEEGMDCLQRLRGMFAFALWDARRQQLFLARDRLGQKPLVYYADGRLIAFASELKALAQLPFVPRQIDPAAIDCFLTYQYIPHPRTIYRHVRKLPPAHYAIWRDGQLRVARYWYPRLEDERDIPLDRAVEELRETLREATRLRLISDVPLGAFLSGGIDSTIVVGLMQQLTDRPVQTFCIGFEQPEFDERTYAREAARHLGTDHREQVVQPDSVEMVDRLAWHYDEPFGDSSAIPTYLLSQWTRQHVTVALTGDAGDELFAGYPRYRAVQLGEWFDRLPRAVRAAIANPLWQHLPASVRQKSRRRRLKKLMAALRLPPEERYIQWIVIFDQQRRAVLYTDDFVRQLDEAPEQFLLSLYRSLPARDFVTRTTLVDLFSYLPCDLLTKVDIASMAHGLECRSPFLDHHVVELAVQLPLKLKMQRLKGKHVLKEAFAEFLPERLRRRPKMGFGVPLDSWFRGPLASMLYDVLLDRTARERGYFEIETVRQLIDEHVHGIWDHSYRLWCLLMLEMWHRVHYDTPQPVSV